MKKNMEEITAIVKDKSIEIELYNAVQKRRKKELELLHLVNMLTAALKLCSGWVEAYGQPETREIVRAALAESETWKESQ